MELLQLKYFCHAAQSGNFTRTAEYFNVPTSNISRAIKCLEKEHSAKLFERKPNKIRLNEFGETFYKHAKAALRELEIAKNSLCNDSREPKGEIRLLVSCCRHLATKAIERCVKQFPNISFSVRHGVDTYDCDFVISDLAPARKSYTKKLLMTENMKLAVSKSYCLNEKKPSSDIENERFVSLGSNTRLHALTLQYCNQLGFTPNVAIQTDDPYYVRKFIELGLGVALYPEKSWANLLSPSISLLDVGFPKRQTFLFYEKDKILTVAEEKFAEILIQEFKKA